MRSSSLSCIVFTLDSFYMKEAFIKLHLSILIAGGTGIFGKLISLNEGLLVWYRMMFASVMFFLLLSFLKKLRKVTLGDVTKIGSVGLLLALHWIFFYGSIKASNVSIGVVCLSLMSIFTAIFEPLINRHRISLREILFSLVAVLGIVLIFHFDTRYRVGICMGVISSALASLFTIVNKKVAVNYTSSTMLLYEMLGGFLGLSCILPAYLHYFPVPSILPGAQDLIYLLCLASVCTVGLYILHPNNIGRCGHICNASYAVKSTVRGQGVGKVIVTDCLEKAKEIGFRVLQFNAVVKSNTTALKLYQKLGFTQLGTIPGGFLNKDGVYEDIIVHYKEL